MVTILWHISDGIQGCKNEYPVVEFEKYFFQRCFRFFFISFLLTEIRSWNKRALVITSFGSPIDCFVPKAFTQMNLIAKSAFLRFTFWKFNVLVQHLQLMCPCQPMLYYKLLSPEILWFEVELDEQKSKGSRHHYKYFSYRLCTEFTENYIYTKFVLLWSYFAQ